MIAALWVAAALADPQGSSWVAERGPWGDAVVTDVVVVDGVERVLTEEGLYAGGVRVTAYAPPLNGRAALTRDGWPAWTDGLRLCAWADGAERCVDTNAYPVLLDGTYASGLQGNTWAWTGDGWDPVTTPLPPGPESNVVLAAGLADGTLWLAPTHGPWRVRGVDGSWAEVPAPVAVDPARSPRLCDGPIAAADAIYRWTGSAWVTLVPPGAGAHHCGGGHVAGDGGRIWRIDGDRAVELPTSVGTAIAGIRDGVAWSGSRLLRPSDSPTAFRDVAPAFGVADPGPSSYAWFVGADGDGLPDLLVHREGAGLRLYRNAGARFEDATLESGFLAERWTEPVLAACDLDVDGLDDLLVYDGSGLRWLRGNGLGWDDVTDRGIDDPDLGAPVSDIDCVDLDGDGDLDVFLTIANGLGDARGWPEDALENTGHGRLRRAPPALRGLGIGATWTYRTLFADLVGDPAPEAVALGSWWLGVRMRVRRPDGRWVDGPPLDRAYGMIFDAVAADFDADGATDLALLHEDHVRFQVQRDGRFLTLTPSTEPFQRLATAWPAAKPGAGVGDVDRDGRPDLLVPTWEGVSWLSVDPDGSIRTRGRAAGLDVGHASALAGADVDRDGDLDLFLPSATGADRLLLNAAVGPGATPLVAPVAPALPRRLAWLRWSESVPRLALVWLGIGLAAGWGRRRDTVGLGRPVIAVALAALAAAVELGGGESSGIVRYLAGLAGLPLVGALAWADLALTRTLRATRVAGYRLEGTLGSGGMATVHLARDGGRQVALKVLHPELAEDPDARDRFRREAELASRFDHPHLVRVHASGECAVFHGDRPRRTLYLALELVDGPPLRSLMGQAVPVGQACRLLVDLLGALELLHRAGVVHRDIKPENLLIRRDGVLKLTDFGVAHGNAARTLTRTGHVLGTLAYMAPEQARGQAVDARADLYAVGALAYELISGQRPFDSDEGIDLVYQLLMSEPPPLAGVPDALADAVARCLAKDPDARWADAPSLAAALAPFADPALDLAAMRARSAPEAPAPDPSMETRTRA